MGGWLKKFSSLASYFTVNKPRQQRYAEFYRNYDADAEYEKMKVID